MANIIYEKLRTKRHYRRHPLCANKLGICEYTQCRCNYSYDLQKAAKGLRQKPVKAMISE